MTRLVAAPSLTLGDIDLLNVKDPTKPYFIQNAWALCAWPNNGNTGAGQNFTNFLANDPSFYSANSDGSVYVSAGAQDAGGAALVTCAYNPAVAGNIVGNQWGPGGFIRFRTRWRPSQAISGQQYSITGIPLNVLMGDTSVTRNIELDPIETSGDQIFNSLDYPYFWNKSSGMTEQVSSGTDWNSGPYTLTGGVETYDVEWKLMSQNGGTGYFKTYRNDVLTGSTTYTSGNIMAVCEQSAYMFYIKCAGLNGQFPADIYPYEMWSL